MIGDIKNSDISNINGKNGLDALDESEKFDLIVSCMELHKYPNPEELLKKYLFSLKPDGALIGCCLGEKSFSSLHRAYLLA